MKAIGLKKLTFGRSENNFEHERANMKKKDILTEFEGIKADFITDAKGNKKQVVLDIEQFRELLETLEDYYDIAQIAIKKHEKTKSDSLEVVKKRLLK